MARRMTWPPVFRTKSVMVPYASSLPPRPREPITRSASPARIGATSFGMSDGSCEPSASMKTTTSPFAFSMAVRTASPFPRPRSSSTRAPSSRAIFRVSSVEWPSTTRISSAYGRMPSITSWIVALSFFAGMTTVTFGTAPPGFPSRVPIKKTSIAGRQRPSRKKLPARPDRSPRGPVPRQLVERDARLPEDPLVQEPGAAHRVREAPLVVPDLVDVRHDGDVRGAVPPERVALPVAVPLPDRQRAVPVLERQDRRVDPGEDRARGEPRAERARDGDELVGAGSRPLDVPDALADEERGDEKRRHPPRGPRGQAPEPPPGARRQEAEDQRG